MFHMNYCIAAIYDACDAVLTHLGKFQDRLLSQLSIACEDALFHFIMVPLRCRRDIAMLGFIHRRTLGKGSEHFKKFLNLPTAVRRRTKAGSTLHSQQLVDLRE